MSPTTIRNCWFIVIWLMLFVTVMLVYRLASKQKDKVIIFEVGYTLSACIMLLVDKLWLTDGDLMTTVILITFPLHLLGQFLILIARKPED